MDKCESNVNISSIELKVLANNFKHFDVKPNQNQATQFINSLISDQNVVANHRFLPFITFNMEKRIYHGRHGNPNDKSKLKIKKRPIALAAYHDALIYAHYAKQLDHYYEQYISAIKIDRVPTAYRRQLHISNIHAAKEVFDHVTNTNHCLIIKGDFKGFFDNLRHKMLSENLCKTLGVSQLSSDWKAVIKSLTRYRSISKVKLIDALKKANIYDENRRSYIRHFKDLGALIKNGQLKLDGPNQIGIPQGTALSAILANVYMTDFDQIVNKLVTKLDGIYRRYSDDFIIAIPISDKTPFDYHSLVNQVIELSQNKVRLKIEEHKMKVFEYHNREITELKSGNKANLDYLGFVFDGKVVRLRNKSIYKFHYKSKRSIKRLVKIQGYHKYIQKKKNKGFKIDGLYFYKNRKYKRFKNVVESVNNRNLKQHRITTKMYLTDHRYGEKYSMIGYAKRAQKILSKNNGQYDVNILQSIKKQIYKNRTYYHLMKEDAEKKQAENDKTND